MVGTSGPVHEFKERIVKYSSIAYLKYASSRNEKMIVSVQLKMILYAELKQRTWMTC